MPQHVLKVGGDLKMRCSRCDLDLTHTIIAMAGGQPARVRCNTCKSERNYRAPKPEILTSRRIVRDARPKISDEGFYNQKLKENAMKSDKPYRIDLELTAHDIVDHKVFGRGIVLKTIPPDRAEILFKDQTRVLVCKC